MKQFENQFLKRQEDIKSWLEHNFIFDYEIIVECESSLSGFVVDVGQSVNLTQLKTNKIPVKFRTIKGDFICSGLGLTDLSFAPQKVFYKFVCSNNYLTSLKGAPIEVGQGFDCSHNQLMTLRFAPQIVKGKFDCSYNQISTLEGAPKKVDAFYGSHNTLENLRHGPIDVGGDFLVNNNRLKSLDGCPKSIGGRFSVNNNQLFEIDFFPDFIGGEIILQKNESLGEVQNYHEYGVIMHEAQKTKIVKEKMEMEKRFPILEDEKSRDRDRGKI